MTQAKKTRRMVESALMIAIATVLSLPMLSITGPWLNGGSVTLFSMLPICLIAYKYGVKWGLFTGFVHGALQLVIGMDGLRGVSLMTFFGAIVLDYLLAYGVLGLAGLLRGKLKSDVAALTIGAFIATVARFVCHFVSGFLLWGSLLDDGFGAVAFSFGYNIGYMGPEIIITTAGAAIMGAVLLKATHALETAA